jgi:hypothetical protein
MIGYQFAGFLNGHIFPHTLNFDLTPGHTSVFTFGIMMLIRKKSSCMAAGPAISVQPDGNIPGHYGIIRRCLPDS